MFFGVDSARGRIAPTLTAFVALSVAGCVTDFSRSGTPATTSAAGAASLDQIVETTPLDHPAREEIREGVRLLRAGRAAGANEIFERGLKRNPSDGVLHFLNGLAYHTRAEGGNKSDLELAETGYQLALKFDPGNIWAAYLLGHIAYRAQRYVDAENYFAYGTLYQPENPELLKGLLVSAYAARDMGTAAWAAKQLEPLATKDPAVRRNAALAYAASGHFEDAQASLAAFRESAGSNAALQPRYAALQRRVGEWQDYFQRNNLPQFAFSDAQPFEDRRRARENRSDQAPAPQAVPRGPVTQGPVDQPATPGAASGAQNRTPAGTQVVFQPEKGPRMVLVDVAIIRTEENRFSRQGVNLLSGLEATLGGTLYNFNYVTGTDAGNSVKTLTHTVNPVFTLAGLTYNLNIFNDGVERAEVLARPSLLAVENKTSEFFSGGVWHVQLVSNLSYGTIEQVPIGINLKVTPQFLDEELLLVDVSAERSFLEERSAEVGFTAFSETTKTSVSATAKLRFGETLILSGLSENENNRQRDGVPVLDKVPVVQYLFSQRSEESVKRSVLILLTPRKAHFMDGPGSTDAARALPPPPQGERFRTELQKREGIRPNLDAVFAGLEYSEYFRQFRTGDMQMVRWEEHDGLDRVIKNFFQMLYF